MREPLRSSKSMRAASGTPKVVAHVITTVDEWDELGSALEAIDRETDCEHVCHDALPLGIEELLNSVRTGAVAPASTPSPASA
jgi:hypothetical protein